MTEEAQRLAIVAAARELARLGLNHGATGNLSVRLGASALVTPSGLTAGALTPKSIARMPLDGDPDAAEPVWEGPSPPSSEWRFHLDILRARPEVNAVVHTHSPYATTLAAMRRDIPAVHYMIAAFGGPTVRCVGYAPYGTPELSRVALEGLEGRTGVLLANHGAIVIGADLQRALWRAVELEDLARLYHLSLIAGGAAILDDDEIMRTVARFDHYGPRDDV
jgi:L-fuculose-phosphate aldolase